MSAPPRVLDLIKVFESNAEDYCSGHFNEADTRQQFINPFFKCLGWDMDNEKGYGEAYKDVVHEAAVKVGGATKAPDYSFRIGGTPKFFLEAKKPAVNIKDDPNPAFQLRRYAWSAKLPLSILTDFEEFAVYDCRVRPAQTDKAAAARTLYLRYSDYATRWDEIASVFSRDAVLKGSFDKYAETSKVKRGTATVDAAFLQEIESWREMLARNLALRNAQLSQRELNYAVQVTIDRIIFLRMCEDRGIEDYGQLMALQNGTPVYGRLRELYRKADQRYNSGLFHFEKEKDRPEPPDELTPFLVVDDKVLKDILKALYYPESPYEFSVLPAEILGQVYEQFLGKVIRLTAGHQARVEEKPEVKKAGGVYYTPAYIVAYIVKNTVGKLLEGKTPRQAARLRILDPACGSGSFLLGAYQRLLNWHRDWYLADGPEKHARELYQTRGGAWRLTTAEKKRILLNNIYGVDIDPQAVEVTKLSLLLRVLEGESQQTLERQRVWFHDRALPDLASNIKCGNSLIGPDFYDGQQPSLFAEEERYRTNAFDWDIAFPWLKEVGGFDVVIGNPPYVRQESLSRYKDYLRKHYQAFEGTADLYVYFIERAISLLRQGGRFSFIVSSSFLWTNFGRPLRVFIRESAAVLEMVDFGGLPVFEDAKDTYVCIPLFAKEEQPERVRVCRVKSLQASGGLQEYVAANHFTIPGERLAPHGWLLKTDAEAGVFAKVMEAGKPLGQYVDAGFYRGVTTGLNEAFVIDSRTRDALIAQDLRSTELIKPVLGGEDIRRWEAHSKGLWLIFTRRGVDLDGYPAIREHLGRWKEDLVPKKTRASKRGRKPGRYKWYEIQDEVAYWRVFEGPKIIFPDITKEPRFCLDTACSYLLNTAYCLGTGDLYLLGILNSRLLWFAISNISIPFGIRAGKYRYRLIYQYMEKVPIRPIDADNVADKMLHDRIVAHVERMLSLHEQPAAAKTPQDKAFIQRQIEATERQIDHLVYELYGLTDEEIRIVEGEAPETEENRSAPQ